jgi:hypothetical protein
MEEAVACGEDFVQAGHHPVVVGGDAGEHTDDLAIHGIGQESDRATFEARRVGLLPTAGLLGLACQELDDQDAARNAGGHIDDVEDLAVGGPIYGTGLGGGLDLVEAFEPGGGPGREHRFRLDQTRSGTEGFDRIAEKIEAGGLRAGRHGLAQEASRFGVQDSGPQMLARPVGAEVGAFAPQGDSAAIIQIDLDIVTTASPLDLGVHRGVIAVPDGDGAGTEIAPATRAAAAIEIRRQESG